MRPIVTYEVVWSVCWSVCHDRELCKNGWTDRDAVWDPELESGYGSPLLGLRGKARAGGLWDKSHRLVIFRKLYYNDVMWKKAW